MRAVIVLGLVGLGLVGSGACTGDTLYDSDAVPPPDVEIVSPRHGAEIGVGDSLDVQVLAADTLGVRAIELLLSFASGTDTVADTVRLTIEPALEDVDEMTSIEAPAGAGELELRAAATNELNAVGRSLPVTVQVRGPEEPVF